MFRTPGRMHRTQLNASARHRQACRAEAYATFRAMVEPGQPTSAEIFCPIIAPSWNVRRLQQHVVSVSQKAVNCTKSCNGHEVVNNLLRLASVAELSVPEGMLNE